MAPPPKHILTAPWGSDTRRAEDRARAKEALEKRARRVSWRALQELERLMQWQILQAPDDRYKHHW